MNRAIFPLVAAAAALSTLVGCTIAAEPPSPTEASAGENQSHGSGHGAVAGAQETAEAPLHILAIDADGQASMTDLLDGRQTSLGPLGAPTAVASDGRYVFASTAQGLSIFDSGMWSWAHGDHFHYYRAAPRNVGILAGGRNAAVTGSALSTAGGTGVFFRDTGTAVLLDNKELADGRVEETFAIDAGKHDGMVAPLGEGAVVSVPDARGHAAAVRFHGADGRPVSGTEIECDQARGAITTAAGVAIGCADGALIATMGSDGVPEYQRVSYPPGTPMGEKAIHFEGRKGRTSVAAVAGDRGAWVLDVREGGWRRIMPEVPLLRVSTVDDKEGHVVALDTAGRIHVQRLTGDEPAAVSAPLLGKIEATSPELAGVELAVDQHRAYLNDPVSGTVYELAFRDGARIARTIDTATTPVFMAETGR